MSSSPSSTKSTKQQLSKMGSSSARKLFKSFKHSDPSPSLPKYPFSTSHKSKSTPALVSSSSAMPFNPQPISTERVNDLVVDESSIPSEDFAIPSIPLRTSSIIPSISEPIIPKSLHSAPMPLPIDSSSRISIASSSRGSIASSRQLPSPPASPLLSPARYSVYCSQPASRCSSMNSAISFSGSLDHRSMARVNPPKREKATVAVSKRISDPEKPLPEIPKPHKTPESTTTTTTSTTTDTTTTPSPSYPFLKVASRSNSSAERAAFLSSAPVRSRISVSPRYKNMTSITSTTSKTSGLTSKSTPSFFTASMSTSTLPLTMGISYHTAGASTQINLDKRRWSNDSTRGLHGSGSSTSLSLSLSSVSASSPNSSAVDLNSATQYACSRYNSDDDDDDGDFELENGNDTHNDYKYFNVQRNYKAVKSQQNGKKKSKLNISLFGFMMKNKQIDASL